MKATPLLRLTALALLSVPAPGQVPQHLYFRMNEGAGTTTRNEARPGAGTPDPTIGGTYRWETPGRLGAAALDLGSGTSATGSIATGWATDLTTDWTIECWLRPHQTTTSLQYVFGDSTASTPTAFRCFLGGIAQQGIYVRTGTPDIHVVPPFAVNTAGLWTHFALVHDRTAGTLTGYVNGAPTTQVTLTAPLGQRGTSFRIGSYTSGHQFNGALDEFRVWNVARSAAEILAHWDQELGQGFEPYGAGCPGAGGFVPTFTSNGPLRIGNAAFALESRQLNGGVAALLVLGLSDSQWLTAGNIFLPLDLGPFGAPGCRLLYSTETQIGPFVASGTTPGSGVLTIPLPIPNQPFLIGRVAYGGLLVFDPGVNALNLIHTPAAKLTIQP